MLLWLSAIMVTWINKLRPRQNYRDCSDIFKCIFLNENAWISVPISLKPISKGPIYNSPSLVQIMAWADQATRHCPNQTWLVYRRKCRYLLLSDLRAQLITVIKTIVLPAIIHNLNYPRCETELFIPLTHSGTDLSYDAWYPMPQLFSLFQPT